MSDVEAIEQAAQFLQVGQSVRIACPFCSPPKEDAECMRVTRWDEHKVSAKCFRATCGRSVKMTIGGGYIVHNADAKPSRPGFVPKYFDRPTRFFTKNDYDYIRELSSDDLAEQLWDLYSHGLDLGNVKFTDDGKSRDMVLRVTNPWDGFVGHQVRNERPASSSQHKYDTMREHDVPFVHFIGPTRCQLVVVVEDYLSALAIAYATNHTVAALAMLGGSTSDEVLLRLAKQHKNIVFFLDPGAEQAAHRLAKRSSLMFRNVGVIRAPADPKRLLFGELKNLLAPFMAQVVSDLNLED